MRLKEVKKRATLANLYSIETAMVDNDFNLKKLNKKQKNIASLFDYVLVDEKIPLLRRGGRRSLTG
jgi:uncharacterized membrane protein (DUF106 family)